jgi:hypothetical protein
VNACRFHGATRNSTSQSWPPRGSPGSGKRDATVNSATSAPLAWQAAHPPRRCDWKASGVTGIALSPAVVPEVVAHSLARPGHVTPWAPARAASHEGLKPR